MKKTGLIIIVMALAVCMLCSCTQDDDKYEMMYEYMVNVWAQSLEGFSCPVAFYGDSRVAGADWKSLFSDIDPEGNLIVNLGVGGDTVERTIQRLSLLDSLEIRYCFLAIGGNDALSDSFDESTFRQSYDSLLTKLSNRGIKVYAHTITGVTEVNLSVTVDVAKYNKKITIANNIIKELVSSHISNGEDIVLVDIATEMNNADGSMKAAYSADGVHFTQEGNRFWADFIRSFVSQAVQNP